MTGLRAAAKHWLPVLLWAALIFACSSVPGRYIDALHKHDWNPLAHFAEFFILGLLILRAFSRTARNFSLTKLVILSIIIASLFAGLDEWHQSFVPQRTPDILDFLIDAAGSIAGILLYIRNLV